MASFYGKRLGTDSLEDTIERFHETIIDTNRSYNFFVNWEKVEQHVDKYKIEISILDSLIGSRNFNKDLENILKKYPEVLPVIPILIAVRDARLKVIRDFSDADTDIMEYNFTERKLSELEIRVLIEFFEKTGLKNFFENLSTKSIRDYVTGVEVGMDTHARKNRSGDSMELVIKPFIEKINLKHDNRYIILFQKNFNYLQKNFGIKVSASIRNRKADFILINADKDRVVNIEVNFYSGTGSKPQEIVDSYINRQEELKENGFEFIWITDGYGWKGQKNQIEKGFRKVNYLLNLHFVRKGLLEDILWIN
ncbi:MAG: restriction endonuclease [Clostridiales bacterium]|jgi:type II restriction enzyme|nr:restriction endonuclease [Clostridiales bacterium]